MGDEEHFGDPLVQKDLALFRKVPDGATYEDLTSQVGPTPADEIVNMDVEDFVDDLLKDDHPMVDSPPKVPKSVLAAVDRVGWGKDDYGNPILTTRKAFAYRTPSPHWDSRALPYRTSWVHVHGNWERLEDEVCWAALKEPCGTLPTGLVNILVIFHSRNRKQICQDSVPWHMKKKVRTDPSGNAQGVFQVQNVSVNKRKKMLDKEVPFDKIGDHEKPAYDEAIKKEWDSWLEYDSCEILSLEQSAMVEKEHASRILPSRFVLRNKHAGLVDAGGTPLPLKAKARLCIAGHLCPDSLSSDVQVDSPTVERISTMFFLNQVICSDWVDNWFTGSISNAFLQGAPIQGQKDMYMRQPKQWLPGMEPGQLLKLIEGSLEVKLPTIWTDEKQSRAEAERRERLEERRVEEKEPEERRCRCAKR